MSPRRLALGGGLIILGIIVGIRYFSDEAVIRRRLQAAARAFEQERVLALAGYLSRSYTDEKGLDYQRILGLSHEAFQTYDDLNVSLTLDDIHIVGESATVSIAVHITGSANGQRGALLGNRSEPARAAVRLASERGNWVIARVRTRIRLPGGHRASP